MSSASSRNSPYEPRRPKVSQTQQTAEAKEAFNELLKNVGANNIDTELQARAKNIHAMDKSLTKQEKDLQKETKKLAKQNDEMEKFVTKSRKQLSAFDDLAVVNADLDADLEDIEEMIRQMEQDELDPPPK